MNPHAAQHLEDILGLTLLPLPVAAQLLGISVGKARRELPLIQQGYRTKCVTVSAMREYIARQTSPQTTKLQIIRK
jgi:hypothetical protein